MLVSVAGLLPVVNPWAICWIVDTTGTLTPVATAWLKLLISTAVWACAGAARASSAVAASRAVAASGPGPYVRVPAS